MGEQRRGFLVDGELGRDRLTEVNRRAPRMLGYAFAGVASIPLAASRGWWVMAVACLALGLAEAFDSLATGRRRPERWTLLALLTTQAAAGIVIAGTEGASSPALVLPLMAVPFYALRFGHGGALVGVVATIAVQIAGSIIGGIGPSALHLVSAGATAATVGTVCIWLLHLETQWRDKAIIDPLTGLLNRRSLQTRLSELEAQSTQFEASLCVIALDIDHFKAVNDTHGHQRGDRVIADVAYAVRSALRQFDLAYRTGGEEFLVLIPGANANTGAEIAERIRARVEASTPGSLDVTVTVSVGVAAATGRPIATEQLLNRADIALYRAKNEGRNRVVLDASVLDASPRSGRRSTDRDAVITQVPGGRS